MRVSARLKMNAVNIRLDNEDLALIKSYARKRKTTVSHAIRELIYKIKEEKLNK